MTTIEEIYEKSFDGEYDNIHERDMETRIADEIKETIHERLTSLGLKHPKEYEDAIDDRYDYTYEATIKDGKIKIIVETKYLLPDINIEDRRFDELLEKMLDEEEGIVKDI